MSRRLSIQAKQEKRKPQVRFPDELVFLDSIKENDLKACNAMLRKASLQLDINGINDAGLTPLHQAVLEGNYQAAKLLISHGADVNKTDTDSWTPLHAACAEGHADIVRYLLFKGARKELKTLEGERALDLVDASDLHTIGAMLESESARTARIEEEEAAEKSKKRKKKGGSKKGDDDSDSSSSSESD
ncbi:uncharacterized protein LOC143281086 [Babylonia areolata]|uniref:uncharacterized protein LOC143281086 n=1 Tax=Babylonia areolata TaxID=304850 RepID=UPI003FD0FB91